MSAAAARRGLAAIGRDLAAKEGTPAQRRAAQLTRALADQNARTIAITDLAAVPEWLRLPNAGQTRLARRAALVSIAPRLATSIDGEWLGSLAKAAGDEALDWAIEHASAIGDDALEAMPPDALDARGFALLRGSLPLSLRDLVIANDTDLPPAICLRCTDLALRAPEAA